MRTAWQMTLLCVGLVACTQTARISRPEAAAESPSDVARIEVCEAYLKILNRTVQRAGVRDAQAARVAGFPYLRLNRFLASFRDEAFGEDAYDAWVERMRGLAEEAWQIELANLPGQYRREILEDAPSSLPGMPSLLAAARACGQRLGGYDRDDPAARAQLSLAAQVPPAYRTWQRVVGLYYVTLWPVLEGVRRWEQETRQVFELPARRLPTQGRWVAFTPGEDHTPLTTVELASLLRRSRQNALGIPEPQGQERARLFATFAPVWVVDVASDADRIGRVGWDTEAALASVNTTEPVVYRHLSHTRFGADVLLQLNYTVWFPQRPRSSSLDLLGGHLDGLTWRVTLSSDGQPLVYDTIHNCGCYHLFFPTARVAASSGRSALQEDTFIPQKAPPGNRISVWLSHSSHYLQRITAWVPQTALAERYAWADYVSLRSLPLPYGGQRSLFAANGIVAGTQRGERWVLWPMGVPAPGAMRQWGHHATAFVGRRHFDDPFLFQERFVPAGSVPTSGP